MTELFTENTVETLREKGWANVNKNGFSVVLYRDDFDEYEWNEICDNAGVDIADNHVYLLCVASKFMAITEPLPF